MAHHLVELTLVPLVRPGLFRSSDAIRAAIGRGELVQGVHYFQARRGGRIRIDVEACEKLFREQRQPTPKGVIRLARGGWMAG
jgi:hypothetical protein